MLFIDIKEKFMKVILIIWNHNIYLRNFMDLKLFYSRKLKLSWYFKKILTITHNFYLSNFIYIKYFTYWYFYLKIVGWYFSFTNILLNNVFKFYISFFN